MIRATDNRTSPCKMLVIACTVMLLASGCAGPWHARQDVRSSAVAHDEVAPPKVATASPSQESASLRIDPYTSLAKHETPADPAQETSLNIFLSEVRSNIALDATAEAQLRKELLQSRQDRVADGAAPVPFCTRLSTGTPSARSKAIDGSACQPLSQHITNHSRSNHPSDHIESCHDAA